MKSSIPTLLTEVLRHALVQSPSSILHIGVEAGMVDGTLREVFDPGTAAGARASQQLRLDGIALQQTGEPAGSQTYDSIYQWSKDGVSGLPDYDVLLWTVSGVNITQSVCHSIIDSLHRHATSCFVVVVPQDSAAAEWLTPVLSQRSHTTQVMASEDGNYTVYVLSPLAAEQSGPRLQVVKRSTTITEVDSVWTGPAPDSLRRLRIAYIIPGHSVNGGTKMLLEQIRRLRQRGHTVHAVYRGVPGTPVLPSWTDVTVDSEQLVMPDEPYAKALGEVDVVMAGWIDQVEELSHIKSPPTLYWEQGHEFLFEDADSTPSGRYWMKVFRRAVKAPIALASVSPFVQGILKNEHYRQSGLILNGVDTTRFWPGTPPRQNRVLLVGNPRLTFKGFDVAMKVLERVHQHVEDLEVVWVSQIGFELSGNQFPIKIVVDPPQQELPSLFRNADLFLSTSWYEAFGLPPLEAMASGVPVVSTDNGGIRTYARPGENCLIADTGDVDSLTWAVVEVLRNFELASFLREAGLRTAAAFGWDAAIDSLEDALYRVAASPRLRK